MKSADAITEATAMLSGNFGPMRKRNSTLSWIIACVGYGREIGEGLDIASTDVIARAVLIALAGKNIDSKSECVAPVLAQMGLKPIE